MFIIIFVVICILPKDKPDIAGETVIPSLQYIRLILLGHAVEAAAKKE
jgi:hypothetical protein